MPVTAAALLVGLLPAQSFALPPDPAKAETGRETLTLEDLERDLPVPGKAFSRHLSTLRADIPQEQLAAPSGSTTPPSDLQGSVTFSTTTSTQTAARTAAAEAGQAALRPVGTLPVSLGQAPDRPTPSGTWQVTIPDRASAVSQGVDGTVIVVQAPDTGSVPVSVKLDYAKFENLYGADWASRLRLVQFPDCYLTTPDDEACQQYEELETTNDAASNSVTATVDPAADDAVTPASAKSSAPTGSGVAQAAYRSSSSATSTSTATTAAAGSGTAVVGAIDSGASVSGTGGAGSFKATGLASDGKWAAGGSSGAFTWSYPLVVPDAPAGPAPKVSFNYSSQSVDGRTAVSSPQASWIGEGWSYDPGYIERRYRTCKDDRKTLKAGEPNNAAKKDKTSDLCWVSYNAVMSLNGETTELVRDASAGSDPEKDTERYRPQDDDGTRVEHRVGGSNDDNNGEYWVVTTTDGTQFYYGLNNVGGGRADTNSVSTVPVFGNHQGEPCHAAAFADSRCGSGKQQAWRWGLDKVVDVHGNVMVVDWKQETNYYAVRKKFKSPEQYDRSAYPVSIDYGMRPDELTKPSATVSFGVKQRCLKSDSACDAANFAKTDDPGAYRPWWDTPGNLNCKSTSKLCPAFPSFWTQLRLDTVTTKAGRAGQTGLGKVDVYTLHQSFPEDWYDTSPGLWLNSITRTGFGPGDTTGTVQSKDGVSFAPYTVGSTSPLHARLKDRQLPNLVSKGKNDQNPGFTRPRIGTVSTEYGGDIEVEYTGGCPVEPTDDKGKDNETCYPVRWSPDGDERTPAKAWFNKYVVDSVTETDKVTSHGKPIVTKYTYTGPAWAKSDDEFTRPALRTYSDWRGYRQVAVTKGSTSVSEQGDPQSQSYSVTRYFLGTGGEVKDSTGTYTLLTDDAPQYAGMTAEAITYRDSDGQVVNRTLNYPWSKQTASRPRENEDGTDADPLLAHRAGIKRTDAIQTLSSDGSWRAVRTLTTVDDDYGLPIQVETAVVEPSGSTEKLSDQTCTVTSYIHNTTAWLIGLPKEQRTTGTSCTDYPNADPATQLKSATRNTYDGLTYGATPTKGQITTVAETNGAGTAYATASDLTYDALGRVLTVTKPGAGTTRMDYTPENGGPVTATKVTDALGHATTTTFDPGRSLPLTVTDPNGRVTRSEYDALGRLVKGWSASRSWGGKSPNVLIDYAPAVATSSENRPAAVTVQTLKDDGSYATEITLYDGLMREVQKQADAHGPGRVITDISYDDHGLPDEQTGAYLAKGDPDTTLFAPRSKSLIPTWTKHRYDGMEREVSASVYQDAEYKYATLTSYDFTSTYTDPPGATAPRIRTYYDALGRVSSIKHYSKALSTSTAARSTTYAYDARGNRSTVTDPAGNVWSYVYDARGRLTSATDPDTGTSSTWYDAADRPNHTQNARKQDAYTEYDLLGRVKNVRQGSTTATPSVEYTYDDAPGGIGQPGSSKRHTDSGDYTSRVTGYDADYHPTGSETVIPSNSMTTGLAGTYTYSYTYTPTGKPQSVTLPAAGGLAKEKVVTRYDSDGLPESTSGLTWYTADATYSPYGEPLRTVSGSQPYRLWTTNFVDPHTGRLQRTVTDRETSGPHRITDAYYSYDASGTITSSARKLSEATGDTWDNQCFTYDAMGELVNAWTSKTVPDGTGMGCTSSGGTRWGYRTDYAPSSGPVADAPDAASDTTSPDSSLTATLAAAAPDTTTVSTDATAYRQSFTFDWLGNRATMTDYNSAVSYTYGYGKPAAGGTTTQPHTMTGISSSPSGKGSTYTYDDSGNTTVRNLATTIQGLVWSPENKLDSITADGKKTTYVYDASGNRLLENSPSGSTLYLGETELTTDTTGLIIRASRSYAQSGAPTVVRTATNGSTTGHKLAVLLTDQLGTANTSVDLASGQPVTRRAYKPYGEIRGTKPTNWPNKRSYLGVGIDDTATGLTHIGAREYDQNSGHFLSADPVIDIADPLQMNGYTYSGNSPVSHSDPSGLMIDGAGDCRYQTGGCNGDPHKSDSKTKKKAAEQKKWVAANSPVTNDIDTLSDKFASGMDGEFSDNFWYNPIYESATQGSACFGREGCRQAYRYILHGGRDAAVAKRIAATYCLYHASECVSKAKATARGKVIGEIFNAGFLAYLGGATGVKEEACSFTPTTRVLMKGGKTKRIGRIKPGDKVESADPRTGRHKGPRRVLARIVNHDDDLVDLTVRTGDHHSSVLHTTSRHPFWDDTLQAWIPAGQLRPGHDLETASDHHVRIVSLRTHPGAADMYNLTVQELHTYYVLAGATPVLVHNCGESDVTTVYRKQDTSIPETQRLSVDADGNVSHAGSGSLYLNMTGDISHSLGFKGDQLVAFDVPTSYVRELSEASLPQRMPRGWTGTKREWNRALKMAPDQSDGPGLFGLRDHHIPGLLDAIIPGSGRIVG